MKKSIALFILVFILTGAFVPAGNRNPKNESNQADMLKKRKEVALLYHQLNAKDVDKILTEDFIGHGESGQKWNREEHKNFLSADRFFQDSVYQVVAEGDWVSCMFIRKMDFQGKRRVIPGMHFKRFEGDKIAELWEYWDFDARQLDTE